MRVCWAGTFDPRFERNRRLAEYLQEADVDYEVVRIRLWPSDRVTAFNERRLLVLARMVVLYPVLIVRLLIHPAPDAYLVSYPGWFDVLPVKLVAVMKRRPVVFDIFISLHDTAVVDRQLASESSITAWWARSLDRLSMTWSDRVIADCPAQARFLADLARLPMTRFGVLYIGADEHVFGPVEVIPPSSGIVLFYGSFVPLQGVEWIVRAAAKLRKRDYVFRIIGGGQDRDSAAALSRSLDAGIEFVDFLPKQELAAEMAQASICLGIFGTSQKAGHVVPHKVYEALACGRPVLTGATDAVLDLFEPNELALAPVGDSEALAREIDRLMLDPERRRSLAAAGRARFVADFSLRPQARRLRGELKAVVGD